MTKSSQRAALVLRISLRAPPPPQVVSTKPSPAIITTVVEGEEEDGWVICCSVKKTKSYGVKSHYNIELSALQYSCCIVIGCSFNDKCYLSVSKDRLALLQGPGPNARVVYIDGGFDLFHVGHVENSENADSLVMFLLVGHYTDSVRKAHEAQAPWMAGIKTLKSLTEEKHFARLKIFSLSGENHFRKVTPTDDEDETNVESKDDDNAEGDEDKG
ncbi:ethanolamine-phosphate cytidylyltransferase-like protein [Tanacetum coccineum]